MPVDPINENNPFRRHPPSGQNLTDRTHRARVSATQIGGCPVAVTLFFSSRCLLAFPDWLFWLLLTAALGLIARFRLASPASQSRWQ